MLMIRFLFIFLCLSSLLNADEPIVVNLAATSQLELLSLNITNQSSSFDKEYQQQLQHVLCYDLNHNGKTKVTSKKDVKHILKGTFQAKTLEIHLPSSKKESIPLTGSLAEDRKKIHQLADNIFEALYHEKGIATSRILYTNRFRAGCENNATKWKSEVWESDYDGENARPITKEGGLCVAPSFAPFGKAGSFLYVSYKTGQSKIFLAPLNAPAEKRKITSIRGNQLMPAYSARAKLIAFVSDATGNPEVFLQSFTGKEENAKPWQATFSPDGAQGSPTFSPDGKRFAFVSNKDGKPRIYVMDVPSAKTNIDELKPVLISRQNRDNTCPSWSPDGKKLAYSSISNKTRQIWVYDFTTKKESQLTDGSGHKENPSWAGNSAHLFYDMTTSDQSELYLIHVAQKEPVKITKGAGEKRFPAWIPFSS